MLEDMTSEKLRDIADWLDASQKELIRYMDEEDDAMFVPDPNVVLVGARATSFVECDAMIADLRGWADALDATDS